MVSFKIVHLPLVLTGGDRFHSAAVDYHVAPGRALRAIERAGRIRTVDVKYHATEYVINKLLTRACRVAGPLC